MIVSFIPGKGKGGGTEIQVKITQDAGVGKKVLNT